MVFFLILGTVCLVIGLVYLAIAILGRSDKFLVSVTGKLIEKKAYKNYSRGRMGIVPHATEFVYSYEVNGRTYKYKGVVYKHHRAVFERAQIFYVRGFPWYSAVNEFYPSNALVFAFMYILIGIMAVWVYFLPV